MKNLEQIKNWVKSLRGMQGMFFALILGCTFTYLLFSRSISGWQYTTLIGFSIVTGFVVYFRERIKKIKFGSAEAIFEEVKQLKEDVGTHLIIRQKLLEIAQGRWGGTPLKLQEIFELLENQVNEKMIRNSKSSKYVNQIIETYKKIDSIGSLKPSEPDYKEKTQKMDEYQDDLQKAFDAFLDYLKKQPTMNHE